VRNHEISAGAPFDEGPFRRGADAPLSQVPEADLYDAGKDERGPRGTTMVVYDAD
jgi:hypothetical protein